MKLNTLADKAMLVKLTVRRATLTRRDSVAESFVQSQLDDTSLTVLSRLFKDKNNPINKIMSAASEVYTYHKNNTLPWADKGPRVLPNGQYMEYTQTMRAKIAHVDSLLQTHIPKYDDYVQLDIAYRSRGQTSARAKVEDYPSADDFRKRMGFDIRFMPMPDRRHFLFDLSEEDEQAFEDSMQATISMVREDAVKRMLEPLGHLVEKLNKPIGTDGHIFRDSAIENIIEGIEQARKLTLDESPEIIELTNALNSEISKYAEHTNWLRESPIVREQAAKKLSDIASAMGAFMGNTNGTTS